MALDRSALQRTLLAARQQLLASRGPEGHWTGELSPSALSTATAVWALAMVSAAAYAASIRRGLDWLARHQNEDGGWGDTTLSPSNISTTLLVWSALAASDGRTETHARAAAAAETWIARHAGSLEPEPVAAAVHRRYGRDRTFSAPILTMAAMAGRLGPDAWRLVAPLPFELAACPHRWLKRLRLPVVSYALPALIAIGQARHHFRPSRCPVTRIVRNAVRKRTLKVLAEIQPPSGGFLEAAPLTSFVTMSLAAIGRADHPVARKGVEFLLASVRPDGSWPIDTNLATWVTTLSVAALAACPERSRGAGPALDDLPAPEREAIRRWLLDQQHLREHPYTHAPPGGWAWTDLAGGVPDADDTAGALVALHRLGPADEHAGQAAAAGVAWLLDLQNRDGGIPTFCRGWGNLPFDRSSPDLTAHALAAWTLWLNAAPAPLRSRMEAAIPRALDYLEHAQTADGAWVPLWFGNPYAPREENPTYGTARVVAALVPLARSGNVAAARLATRGAEWLLAAQNGAGAWGGAPTARASIEETALAVDALARFLDAGLGGDRASAEALRAALARGTDWLIRRTDEGRRFDAAPIGLYFAALWYFERLYPLLFTVSALERASAIAADL
jgi:squalene-hopene/tetraprenyl-beta-curcumene cyclase